MAHRPTAAVMLMALLTACATPRGVRLDTGRGEPLEHTPPTGNKSVEVGPDDFERALMRLVLEMPLTLRSPQQGWLVLASHPSNDEDAPGWRLMGKSFNGFCKPGQHRPDCLSLLDDVAGLTEWDKLGVALGLSVDPLQASISKAVEDTLAPQLFFAIISTGIISWTILAANPEPVFTKGLALVSALMLIYLGVDVFLEVVAASRELKRATGRATTWEELTQASQRFANRVGPEVARVFILAVTVAVTHGMTGGSAWLSSRLAMLPRYSEAAATGASQVRINLAEVGQVSSVAVVGDTVVISLPSTAVAMGATGPGGKGGSVATQGSGTNLTTTRQSGGTSYRFNTGHAFNRAHKSGTDLRNTNLAPDAVETAIIDHLKALRASGGTLPTVSGGAVPQPYMGRVGVGGHLIEFSAVQAPGGTVSIGTYYLLP